MNTQPAQTVKSVTDDVPYIVEGSTYAIEETEYAVQEVFLDDEVGYAVEEFTMIEGATAPEMVKYEPEVFEIENGDPIYPSKQLLTGERK